MHGPIAEAISEFRGLIEKKQTENVLTEFAHSHFYSILMRERQDVLWCETDDETGILSEEYASKKTQWLKEVFVFFKL